MFQKEGVLGCDAGVGRDKGISDIEDDTEA